MEHKTLSSRRRHSQELKAQVLAQCREPGASIAAIALAHGVNANLVHKWRRHAARLAAPDLSSTVAQFVALPMTSAEAPCAVAPSTPDIRIELRRGAVTMNILWPVGAAGECAHWLRELLR
jgi:transposase